MLTQEDKQLIAEYMGWTYHQTDDKKWWNLIGKDGSTHLLDLNDAGLCVQEVQKRGEWGAFMNHTWSRWSAQWRDSQASQEFVLHLFNAENFFAAMSQWLKEEIK